MNWITHQNFDPHIAKSAAAQTLGFRSCDAKTFLSAKFSVSFDCFLSAELSTQRNYCNHVDKLKVRRHSLNNVFICQCLTHLLESYYSIEAHEPPLKWKEKTTIPIEQTPTWHDGEKKKKKKTNGSTNTFEPVVMRMTSLMELAKPRYHFSFRLSFHFGFGCTRFARIRMRHLNNFVCSKVTIFGGRALRTSARSRPVWHDNTVTLAIGVSMCSF